MELGRYQQVDTEGKGWERIGGKDTHEIVCISARSRHRVRQQRKGSQERNVCLVLCLATIMEENNGYIGLHELEQYKSDPCTYHPTTVSAIKIVDIWRNTDKKKWEKLCGLLICSFGSSPMLHSH